jgi:hypothetical protein
MSQYPGAALASAETQVAAARDDPAARLALIARTYHGPTGRAPQHLPFRRAALSFMRWQARRGVLNPLDASPPGSVWWRAVNERLLRDGCEDVALLGGLAGEPSSQAVRLWLEFGARPTGATGTERTTRASWPRTWSTASSPSGERAGALLHERRARARPLRARACRGTAPRAGKVRSGSAACSATPGSGMAGLFLSLRRVLPNRYPLALDVERYIADEQRLGRLLDYAVDRPPVFCSASTSGRRTSSASRESSSWFARATRSTPGRSKKHHVWHSPRMRLLGRILERATRAGDSSPRPYARTCAHTVRKWHLRHAEQRRGGAHLAPITRTGRVLACGRRWRGVRRERD